MKIEAQGKTPDAAQESSRGRWAGWAGRAGRAMSSTLLATLLLPAALLSLGGCKGKAAADTAPEAAITVETSRPERGALAEHVSVDAVLSPVAQSAISPKISAPVRRFYVQRGSHVKQGELLATLENADLAAAAMDSRGSYTAAEAAYETATKAQVPEDYQKAELDVQQAKANLDLNRSIVAARKQLFDQGALPGRDLDTAQAGLVQAQAAYDAAAKHLASQQSVSREAALKAAKGQLASAEGRYRGASAQVGYSEIRSPLTGVVTDRPLFAGETASAGAPLLTVMDTSSLLAKVHLAQTLAQRLSVGGAGQVIVPGLDAPVEARISLISPALDPGSTTVEVWLRLDNRAGTLKVGTPVHAVVTGRTVEHALTVPDSAVVTATGGGSYVMVVRADGVAHKRAVELGIRDAGKVQVLSGLTEKDQVVTAGAFTLEDGAKVTVGAPGEDKADKTDTGEKRTAGKAAP